MAAEQDVADILRKHAVKNALDYGEAQKDSVIGKVFAEHPELKENAGEVVSQADDIIADVNALSEDELEEFAAAYEYEDDTGEEDTDPLPDLEDAEDGVVVRFAPNPNGPPTLGSSRGMVVNGALRDKYDGTLILRFDDTDPRTKRPLEEAYDWYQEDFDWLGYPVDEVIYSSKRFDTYIQRAEELIEMEQAYVCKCSPEEGRKYREEGEACPHRDQSAEENMDLWQQMRGTASPQDAVQAANDSEMRSGGSEDEDSDESVASRRKYSEGISEGEATLKIKTDMQHKNPAIRDFVAFRIIDDPDHPTTGDEYRVWPLLDFAGAIEDHEMGTTHIVRGKDLQASTERQKYIYDYFDWEYPHVHYWGRVNIHDLETPMSTSTLSEMIADGELNGWDDPRAPTVRALKRRGFQPEAIRDFWLEMGVTENDVEASMDTLNSFNRKQIDEEVDRYFFVQNPVRLEISGVDEDLTAEIPYHPEADRGERRVTVAEEDGEVVVYIDKSDLEDGFLRLKDLCNVEVEEGQATFHSIDHTEAIERNASIIQWVPENAADCNVHMPDGSTVNGLCEQDTPQELVQFVRFGFVNVTDIDDTVEAFFTHP